MKKVLIIDDGSVREATTGEIIELSNQYEDERIITKVKVIPNRVPSIYYPNTIRRAEKAQNHNRSSHHSKKI